MQGQAGRSAFGAVAGAAAVGLIAGLAANLGRKAVMQAAEGMAGDWFDILKAEHLMVLELFDKLEDTGPEDTRKRTLLLTKIRHALEKHASQEEMVIYPALKLGGSAEEAQHLYADHGEVKTFLYELDQMDKGDPQWLPRARALRLAIEEHAREEEETIFPALRDRMPPEEQARLTRALHKEGFKHA